MSKAYSLGLTIESRKNEATSTVPAYCFVRLCTTHASIDIITTRGTKMYGVTQEAINPSAVGKVAICAAGGITRIKMAGTAYTTANLATTNLLIGANASGRGARMTTTTVFAGGQVMCTWAASDIVPIALITPSKYKL